MGAGRPLFGLVEPAILFQRILRLLSGFEIAQRGPRVRQTRACRAGSGRFAPVGGAFCSRFPRMPHFDGKIGGKTRFRT